MSSVSMCSGRSI